MVVILAQDLSHVDCSEKSWMREVHTWIYHFTVDSGGSKW